MVEWTYIVIRWEKGLKPIWTVSDFPGSAKHRPSCHLRVRVSSNANAGLISAALRHCYAGEWNKIYTPIRTLADSFDTDSSSKSSIKNHEEYMVVGIDGLKSLALKVR